jgi:hypothetical protein
MKRDCRAANGHPQVGSEHGAARELRCATNPEGKLDLQRQVRNMLPAFLWKHIGFINTVDCLVPEPAT